MYDVQNNYKSSRNTFKSIPFSCEYIFNKRLPSLAYHIPYSWCYNYLQFPSTILLWHSLRQRIVSLHSMGAFKSYTQTLYYPRLYMQKKTVYKLLCLCSPIGLPAPSACWRSAEFWKKKEENHLLTICWPWSGKCSDGYIIVDDGTTVDTDKSLKVFPLHN